MKKFLESNKNENTTYQNLWDTEKTVLRANFIAISVYIKKKQNRDFSSKQPNDTPEAPRKTRTKPKTTKWREIIKIMPKSMSLKPKFTKIINETIS
jgi:L-rhamnose mutarotase